MGVHVKTLVDMNRYVAHEAMWTRIIIFSLHMISGRIALLRQKPLLSPGECKDTEPRGSTALGVGALIRRTLPLHLKINQFQPCLTVTVQLGLISLILRDVMNAAASRGLLAEH